MPLNKCFSLIFPHLPNLYCKSWEMGVNITEYISSATHVPQLYPNVKLKHKDTCHWTHSSWTVIHQEDLLCCKWFERVVEQAFTPYKCVCVWTAAGGRCHISCGEMETLQYCKISNIFFCALNAKTKIPVAWSRAELLDHVLSQLWDV